MKAALLVIDLQKQFSGGPNTPFFDSASRTINRALNLFRSNNLPVIWIQQTVESRGLVPGTEGFDFIEGLDFRDDEYSVHKHWSNSFNGTGLDEILKKEGADTVVVSGFRAQNCINETYCGALESGYTAAVLKDGIASDSLHAIRMVESCCDCISLRLLEMMVNHKAH